jgi:hypothetical protein
MAGAPAQDYAYFSRKRGFSGEKLESALKGGDLNPQSYIKNVFILFSRNTIFPNFTPCLSINHTSY